MLHRMKTTLIAGLTATLLATSTAGQCFDDGEILMYSPNIPTGPMTTERGIIRLDPTDFSTSVLYTSDTIIFGPRIAHDPFRRAALLRRNNTNQMFVIDADGNQSVVTLGLASVNRFAPSGDGKIYITSGGGGSPIGYVDASDNTQMLLLDDGVTEATINSNGLIDSLYYHGPSNSLYYDRRDQLGPGLDEDYIVQLVLSGDGTRVVATNEVQVNQSPINNDSVAKISFGRNPGEIYYHLDVNNSDLWPRGLVLDTETLISTPYFESGFFRASGADLSVYSPNTDSAIVYTLDGFREYDFGDVDAVGAGTLIPIDYVVNDMVIVDPRCRADTNRDGTIDPSDFNAWILAYNLGSNRCDQNRDCLCDPSDFNAWILNFNNGC